MIKNTMPLSMTEALGFISGEKEKDEEVKKFIKKFVKLKPDEGKKMRERLEEIGLIKIKSEHIAKIIDLLPEDSEGLNKIFTDVSLDEDEAKKIFDVVGEFK